MSGIMQLLLASRPQAVPDPYFEYTTLLLPGNGTNGAQNNTFLDSSTNAFSITRNGNTTQGTFSPFSQTGWGNFFDGTGDYLSAPSNAAFALPGDFTFEAWIYPTSWSASIMPVFVVYLSTIGGLWIGKNGSNFVLRVAGVADQLTTATLPTLNTWTHVAVVRSGTTATIYYNGTAVVSGTVTYSFVQEQANVAGDTTANSFSGYISNLRLVKGTAVYTGAFTPPTAPLTAISGTSLLTCQSNRFIDNSTNNFTITRNGDVSVQAFSPFNPTAAWSAATNGGSGYFDGSGDFLNFTASSISTSADFTVECWIYPNASISASNYGIFSVSDARFGLSTVTGDLYLTTTGGDLSTLAPLRIYQWNHIAVTRTSNVLRVFLNGSQVGATQANSQSLSGNWRIANDTFNQIFPACYISGARILIGTGGTSVPVPTAPPTAITNTNFLCNFTNAGIYDATSKNDLETVGNVQISTTQSKFGGSSMYFDGTGDRLFEPSNQNYNFGTGDFTIELWAYPISQGGHGSGNNDCFIDFRPGANGVYGTLYIFNNGTGVYWFVNSANRITGGAISNGTWTHIAIARASGSTKLFINGTQSGSTYADTNNYLVSPIMIGEFNDGTGGGNFQGYIDDLRITKGVARYTSNFTPPTTAFPLL